MKEMVLVTGLCQSSARSQSACLCHKIIEIVIVEHFSATPQSSYLVRGHWGFKAQMPTGRDFEVASSILTYRHKLPVW